jgi:hypothetical protein
MPVTADWATIGGAAAFNTNEEGGVERVTLGAIPAFAGAAPAFLFGGRFFHGDE